MVGDGSLKRGTLVWEFFTPGIGHLLAAAGSDFVFLDAEHSGLDIHTMKSVLRYFEAAGVAVMVRPPGKSYAHIANVLDIGAEGVILPMVASAAEAREIAAHARYAPQGHRGVALTVGHDRYTDGPVREKLDAANRRTVVVALVETAEGAANVDDIAAVDGIDVLWIGHLDLSTSLGCAGQFDHPDYVAAVARIVAAARANGKSLGRAVGSAAEGAALYRQGYEFICLNTDSQMYLDALRGGLADLRAQAGAR
jgi:2-dehydro-3-deoxyglucarate aldolase/4-hydroxy-2-oxoheptanedioate aldolase